MSPAIPKTASDRARLRAPSLFYRSAREGMADLFRQDSTWRGESRTVLLPGFIGWSPNEGSGVFDPVDQLGLTPRFYDLGPDLAFDPAAIEAACAAERIDVIVVIHYFGRVQPALEEARAIADRHGCLLVEDLAHGYFTALMGGQAGRTGDVLAYSLHKMFAMPDAQGGQMVYRDTTYLTGQADTAPELAREVLDMDAAAVAVARRRVFSELTRRLRDLPGHGSDFELMWPELRDDESPQTLPVRILGPGRDRVYHSMNAEGIGMVSLYHTLIPQLSGFDAMVQLSQHIINFPVHQDVAVDDVPEVVAAFARALAEDRTA
nr:DegT/DnrJ/EryC1/StrS family aminotransferase [uncultured Nocardioides sp.]